MDNNQDNSSLFNSNSSSNEEYTTLYNKNLDTFTKIANNIKTQNVLSASFVLIGWVIFFIGIIVFVTNIVSNAENYNNYNDYYSFPETGYAVSSGGNYGTSYTSSLFNSGAIAGLVIYVIGILIFIGAYIGILINTVIMYSKTDYKITNNASEGVKVALIVSNVLVFFFPVIGAILFMIFVIASSNTKTEYFTKQVTDYTNKQLQRQTNIINQ